MRIFLALITVIIIFPTYAQKNKGVEQFFSKSGSKRVTQESSFENPTKPKYKFEYKYNKKGLLVKKTKKHFNDNQWLPLENLEYEYDIENNIVVGQYIPSPYADGALDIELMKNIKKSKKETDTIKVENGKVVYLAQFRKKGGARVRRTNFTYDGDNLVKVLAKSYRRVHNQSGPATWKLIGTSPEISLSYHSNGLISTLETKVNNKIAQKFVAEIEGNQYKEVKVLEMGNAGEFVPRLFYEFDYTGTILSSVTMYATTNGKKDGQMQKLSLSYTDSMYLSEFSGATGNLPVKQKYTYEKGIGNASLFEVEPDLIYYFIPEID